MPFDEETKDLNLPKNAGLKNVSSKKSIFDDQPKKPSEAEFRAKVEAMEEKKNKNQIDGKNLSDSFLRLLKDKTLQENKGPFVKDMEREVLKGMVDFAIRVNNDENEQEGMGSLPWVALLLNICLAQRDRMNQLEYQLEQLKNAQGLDKTQNEG